MIALTAKQQKILAFIKQSIVERQMPPTVHEIAEYMGYRSDNAAYQHLNALKNKGAIRMEGHSRGITLLSPQGLPVVGQVAAGSPILAEQNIENHVIVEAGAFHPRADFLLKVKGMSMQDAGIWDGDLLAVHKTPVAEQSQIVVARLGEEVTVKRFYRHGDNVTLAPENSDFESIQINLSETELVIEGVMAGLIRQQEQVV
ncbi:MAG: transcriptional repressor LexA [Methylococcales bacterium]